MTEKQISIYGHVITVKVYDKTNINIICPPDAYGALRDMYNTVGCADFADLEFNEFVIKLLDIDSTEQTTSG